MKCKEIQFHIDFVLFHSEKLMLSQSIVCLHYFVVLVSQLLRNSAGRNTVTESVRLIVLSRKPVKLFKLRVALIIINCHHLLRQRSLLWIN